jgi:hypothetical protein
MIPTAKPAATALLALTAFSTAFTGAVLSATAGAAAAGAASPAKVSPSLPGVLNCKNKVVVRPSTLVLACADYNAELTKTHWATWGATRGSGTTDFGLNLCVPYCAASKVSFFPGSKVQVSAPVMTKHHGHLFSKLVVTYKLKGKTHQYSMSWKGTPQYA